MNDRFKFRSWDDYNREMFDLQEQDTNPYNIGNFFAQHNIMQCTGLKDKNGKLIYEGDVVKFEEIYECACFTNLKVVLFEIVWSDYGFMAKQIEIIKGNESYEFPLTLSELLEIEPFTEHQTIINLEVIGNIYENPELFKECE